MKLLTSTVLALSLLATPVAADRLDPASVEYVGYFTPPSGTSASVWDWGMHGMTLISDCMGQGDPSPNDGYPGCIGAFGHVYDGLFGVFDIVPPGGQSQQVVPFYALGGTLPSDTLPVTGTDQYWDSLYDKTDEYCRIWWTYGPWYVNISEDNPFLGVSSCDPANPNPQGMWDFGQEWVGDISADPFATAKMYGNLSLIPQNLADRLFGGKRMNLGLGANGDGTVGRSQGPSLYVRDLDLPLISPVLDATPLLWYQFTGFVKWWDEPQMNGGAARHWTQAEAYGAEFVSAPGGEAVVMPWREPTTNPNDYPCSDPTAYRDNDSTTPPPCEIPVCWYGVGFCKEEIVEFQQPSFWDTTSTGESMPVDCNVSDPCGDYTGMHCLSVRPYMIFYDVDELGAVYSGALQHNQPQPYAKIPISLRGPVCKSKTADSTYDNTQQLMYISQAENLPSVHMYSIGEGSTPPPPPPTTNNPPTANAGVDQVVEDTDESGDESIVFDGSASSDTDGTITTYAWGWSGSGHVSGVSPQVVMPEGSTTVTLTVTDDDGATDTDTVLIIVNSFAPPPPPPPPVEPSFSATQLTTLAWDGIAGTEVDIYRNKRFMLRTANDGEFIYAAPRRRKLHTYKLCDTDGNCISTTDG